MADRPSAPAAPPTSPWIKGLVVLHLVAITLWTLPNPPHTGGPPQGSAIPLAANSQYVKNWPPLRNYLTITGFWQYWDMFAPNPTNEDVYGSAEITFRDGTRKNVEFGANAKGSGIDRFFGERQRKFYDRARFDENRATWPAIAQRLAVRATTHPDNPPVTVSLTRHWRPIDPPGRPQRREYRSFLFFTHPVDQAALSRSLRR